MTEANTQDRLGGFAVLMERAYESGRLELLWVDQGYSGEKFAHAIAFRCSAKFEVVKRTEAGGFLILVPTLTVKPVSVMNTQSKRWKVS